MGGGVSEGMSSVLRDKGFCGTAEPELLDMQENESMEILKYFHFLFRKNNLAAQSTQAEEMH